MRYPKISVIVLNWNGLKDTMECLESVKKNTYPSFEIVVVDNGSTDGSVNVLKEYPGIVLIENQENLGYAGGNNVGIKYALNSNSDYMLILNNDTIIDSQAIAEFIKTLSRYPDAGICGGKIYYYSEPNRIYAVGEQWDKKILAFKHIGINEYDTSEKFNQIVEVDHICGSSLFVSRDICEKIGLFDEKYFLLWEESDLCARAQKAGYKIMVAPSIKIWHKVSSSFEKKSPLYSYYYTRHRLLWASCYMSPYGWFKMFLIILKEFFPCAFEIKQHFIMKRLYWDFIQFIKSIQNKTVLAILLGIRDYSFKRFGRAPEKVCNLLRKTANA